MSKYNSSAILQMNSDIITLCGENTFPICVNSREEDNCTEIHFAKVIALVGDSHSRRWLQIKIEMWECRIRMWECMRGNLNFCFSWTRVKMRLCTHFGKVIARWWESQTLSADTSAAAVLYCAVRLLSASAARLAWLIEQHPEKFLWEKYLLHSCQSQRIYFVQQGDWPENRLATRLPTVVKTCIRATPLSMNVQIQNGSKKLLKISTFVSWLLAYEKTLTFTNSTAGE